MREKRTRRVQSPNLTPPINFWRPPVASPLLVLFSLAARRKLRQRCTRATASNPEALRIAMNDIERQLQIEFRNSLAAIVQNAYVTYRPEEGAYILLVELAGRTTRTAFRSASFARWCDSRKNSRVGSNAAHMSCGTIWLSPCWKPASTRTLSSSSPW